MSSLGRLYKNFCIENIELEFQLNESEERTGELLENFEDDKHVWDSKKQKLQDSKNKNCKAILQSCEQRIILRLVKANCYVRKIEWRVLK